MAATDIRVMVPRVRRALEGAGAPETLTNEAIKDIVADALSDILLLTGSVFGKSLSVSETEGDPPIPSEYVTSDPLGLDEQAVVSAQAALNHFFFAYGTLKVSERIADEAQSWEYQISASLLRDRLKQLQADRDTALERISAGNSLDSFVSFIAVRDYQTSLRIEDYTHGAQGGLETDWRFG